MPQAPATAQFIKSPLRVPPQDLPAEQALLGSLMIKPDSVYEIFDLVSAGDFYAEKHRKIFKAMLELKDRNEPLDIVALTNALKEKKWLEQVGGASYLAELLNSVPSAANVKHYAEIVRKKSVLRQLIESADRIAEMSFSENEEIDSIFDQAHRTILEIGSFTKRAFLRLKDALTEAVERFEHLKNSDGGLRGVPTGFRDIDNKLAGLQKSDLIILAARPSVGKTSLALDIARHAATKFEKAVGIFSLEMSSQQLVDRMLAAESQVDSWHLRTGRVKADDDVARVIEACDRLAKAKIFIDDTPGNNITQMRAMARKLKAEHGLDLVVVDYLQLMIPKRDSDSLVQQVTEISRSLKALARELEVPVLALSQLNRSVEQRGGKPRLSDLRDSGSIEQDADVVMFIHREDRSNPDATDRKNIADILIAKHRNGPVGELQLYFDEQRTSFQTLEKSDFGGF